MKNLNYLHLKDLKSSQLPQEGLEKVKFLELGLPGSGLTKEEGMLCLRSGQVTMVPLRVFKHVMRKARNTEAGAKRH